MDIYLNFGSLTKLPVLPSSFKLKGEMNNTEVNINNLGMINLLGKRGLKEIEFQTIFPKQQYDFCKCKPEEPYSYCEKIQEQMEKNTVGIVTITETGINIQCTIQSFEFGEEDNSGDVFYNILFKEYRNVTVSRENKGSKKTTYKAQKGDTFYKISRKFFGNSAYAEKIAKANKLKKSYKFKKSKKIKIPAVS